MKPIRLTLIVSALAVLSGCVAVPVDPGYYGDPRGYYGADPAYYGAPYYGPSIGIGIYGGSRSYRDGWRRDHDRRDRDGWRRDHDRRDRDGWRRDDRYRDGRR